MGKIEYRLDEYREYKDGEWGPWQKLDGRLFDGDISTAAGSEEYAVYEKWRFRKLTNKTAWIELKKIWAFYYEQANDTKLNKSDRRHIAEKFGDKCEKIEGYLKEIGDKIIQGQEVCPVEGAERKEKHKSTEIINEITGDDNYFLFDCHIGYLAEKGYLETRSDCLIWKRGGSIMLAAYFGMLQEHHNPMKKRKWAPVEKVFKVYAEGKLQPARNLAQQYKDFEDVKKCKSNKHDEEYKELKALIEGKIKK